MTSLAILRTFKAISAKCDPIDRMCPVGLADLTGVSIGITSMAGWPIPACFSIGPSLVSWPMHFRANCHLSPTLSNKGEL